MMAVGFVCKKVAMVDSDFFPVFVVRQWPGIFYVIIQYLRCCREEDGHVSVVDKSANVKHTNLSSRHRAGVPTDDNWPSPRS